MRDFSAEPNAGAKVDTASYYIGAFTAVVMFSSYYWFYRVVLCLVIAFLGWCLSAYFTLLTFRDEKPNIPQKVRDPIPGKKWKDYNYKTDHEDSNIFFFMWLGQMSCLIAPYEILIYELSHDDLLNAQELNHASIQTEWNRKLEKDTGCPFYSFWQVKVWKHIMFNYLRVYSVRLNLAVGCALEAMFCWLVYLWNWNNGFIYRRMNVKTWVWTYHLLEEVEHTHISVPEMRQNLTTIEKIITWFIFDVFVVIPITLILVPIATTLYFPRRVFSFSGLQALAEFCLFCAVALPFAALGQFCEMVIGLNWKASCLEDLWNVWYETQYLRDCFEDGKEIFALNVPPECTAKNNAVLKTLSKVKNPFASTTKRES